MTFVFQIMKKKKGFLNVSRKGSNLLCTLHSKKLEGRCKEIECGCECQTYVCESIILFFCYYIQTKQIFKLNIYKKIGAFGSLSLLKVNFFKLFGIFVHIK